MTRPVVRVVGLGPGGAELMTGRSRALLEAAPVARLRTRVHPAAESFPGVESYDARYDEADGFDELYAGIADDLAALAASSPTREVVYAVPGSPVVAERTVELLRARGDVDVVCEPAVSVVDLACAAMGVDPMAAGLRVADALDASTLHGPGPVLVLQAYSPEVLAALADALPPGADVTVLHHLGLADESVVATGVAGLARVDADHLTSLWVQGWPGGAAQVESLAALAHRLRAECPWDAEQSHGSLTRHLLEEAYEAIDALDALGREGDGAPDQGVVDHAVEELGDLLFHVVFHAELGAEAGLFDLAAVAERETAKLVSRHPHVFGDAEARTAREVEERWEVLKRAERGRGSALDGVAFALPALALYTKLLHRAEHAGHGELARARRVEDATGLVDALVDLCARALDAGVDLEGELRERAMTLADALRAAEPGGAAQPGR